MSPISASAKAIGMAYIGLVTDGQISANALKLTKGGFSSNVNFTDGWPTTWTWGSSAQDVNFSADSAASPATKVVSKVVAEATAAAAARAMVSEVLAEATAAWAASVPVDHAVAAAQDDKHMQNAYVTYANELTTKAFDIAFASATFPNGVPKPGMLVEVHGLEKKFVQLNGEQCKLINSAFDKLGNPYWMAHCWNAPIESTNTSNKKYFNLRVRNMTYVGEADIAAGSKDRFKAGALIKVVGYNTRFDQQQCMLIDSANNKISWNAYCPHALIQSKHEKNDKIFNILTGNMQFEREYAGAFFEGWKVLVTYSRAHPSANFQVCTLKNSLETESTSRQWRVQCGKESGDFLGLFPVRTTIVWEGNMLLLTGNTRFQAGMIVKVGGSVSSMYSAYIGAECKVLAAASDSQGLDAWMVECSSAGMRNNETQDNVIVLRAEHMTYVSWP